jgi:hypothetical protein
MWGADLFQYPSFSSNLASDKISHFVKVTGNEGHRHFILFWVYDLHMNFRTFIE